MGFDVNQIVSYRDMCNQEEQEQLQRGMNCKMCGSKDNLHFDHILPYSKGGTSLSESNIQLLCARHNLQKSAQLDF